ncbi:hypothetical protein GKC33_05325 [Lactobacillus salivarius]|uniref:Uncharacterized protein n=2 Tax=Ligilactobacillus salivarius TaxID=1624 RepID=A0A7X2MEU8_9LACO|nr:hypothetical protein [Ligilactobacillus salivarius]
MPDELVEKLKIIQKKYPDNEYRVLHIVNPDFNITLAMRNFYEVVLIDTIPYKGVVYTKMIQDWDNRQLEFWIIVNELEFTTSTVRGFSLIKQYGI